LVDSGLSWWEFTHGEERGILGGLPPPDCLTISSNQRGAVTVSRAGTVICGLRRGVIVFPTTHVFTTGPFGEFLSIMAAEFRRDLLRIIGSECWGSKGTDDDYVERFFLEFLKRILSRVKTATHGGTILIIPDDWTENDSRFRDRLAVKYPLNENRTWHLLLDALHTSRDYFMHSSAADKKSQITAEEFRNIGSLDAQMIDLTDLIRDQVRLIASLTAVDGAVVLTTRLRILGFGAEIVAHSAALTHVAVASSAASEQVARVALEEFGTRHRSAFRFCSSHDDVAAFIVSQDGDIRVARRVGPDVVMWSEIEVDYFT
jgi:hypothetical protein